MLNITSHHGDANQNRMNCHFTLSTSLGMAMVKKKVMSVDEDLGTGTFGHCWWKCKIPQARRKLSGSPSNSKTQCLAWGQDPRPQNPCARLGDKCLCQHYLVYLVATIVLISQMSKVELREVR